MLRESKHRSCWRRLSILGVTLALAACAALTPATPQEAADKNAPVAGKVEPPNWWVGLTPELMVLLLGHNLEATHVTCNLPGMLVTRTQATAGGNYLFVWLKMRV